MFYETDSYKTFVNKYSDNGEYFDSYGNGGGRMEITSMNFESYNKLTLELDYNPRSDHVREYVECYNIVDKNQYYLRGSLAKQFIEQVNCLDGPSLVSAPTDIIDENGNAVPIRINQGGITVDYG